MNRSRVAAVVAIAASLVVACGSKQSKVADDDDGASGGAGTSPAACSTYLSCVAAAQPDVLSQALQTYGPDGDCWTALGTSECLNACVVAFDLLSQSYPDVPECAGMGGAGGGGGGGAPGLYFLTLSPSFSTQTPIVMSVNVESIDATWSVVLQPLASADRKTPIGAPIQRGPYAKSSSVWELGDLTLPFETNPISDSSIAIEGLVLQYEETLACGTAAGEVVMPAPLPLDNSTFTLVPIASIDEAPEPPEIDCSGNTANPL